MGATSKISYCSCQFTGKKLVAKKVTKYLEYNVFINELFWLGQISDYFLDLSTKGIKKHIPFPKLQYFSNKDAIIYTEYIGPRVDKYTMPKDWVKQAEYILECLRLAGISHNDIKPDEILVKDDKLYLCDFGWATSLHEDIPKNWPKGLGGKFAKKENGKMDDRYSLYLSLNEILGNNGSILHRL